MLIHFNRNINYGDLFITSQGGYFLVVRNIFNDEFPISVIDLTKNKVDDEIAKLDNIKHFYDIVEVIPANQIILTKENNE